MEREVDGVRLDRLQPGSVREVSPSIASWLIVEGYAVPEMRRVPGDSDVAVFGRPDEIDFSNDRRRKS